MMLRTGQINDKSNRHLYNRYTSYFITVQVETNEVKTRSPVRNAFKWLTQLWSKDKNVDDKNESVGGNVRVWVRVREVPPFVFFHFQQFYHSTYLLFCFSTFLLSILVG